ncbi:MAG: DUF169 domain-containing protein [Bacteroidales bacterium]|nr:DUF169 domain-containing protein [Bacteroidales bacterium]
MDVNKFISNFKIAFGNYELPIVFWYSQTPADKPIKSQGCFIKDLKHAREGGTVSFDRETIGCGGVKPYTGFSSPAPHLPNFESVKEKYKETPQLVTQYIDKLAMPSKEGLFINFTSISNISTFEQKEGLIFFATPDVLSGLVSWAHFDTDANQSDAVSAPFGSGCSLIISHIVTENQNKGSRVFLGLFDPSVRPHVQPNILSLAIPMSRFATMYHTFEKTCLIDSNAWSKVQPRINAPD